MLLPSPLDISGLKPVEAAVWIVGPLLLGQQQSKAVSIRERRPSRPEIISGRGLRTSVQHDDQRWVGRKFEREMAKHPQVAGVIPNPKTSSRWVPSVGERGALVWVKPWIKRSHLPWSRESFAINFLRLSTFRTSPLEALPLLNRSVPNGCCTAQNKRDVVLGGRTQLSGRYYVHGDHSQAAATGIRGQPVVKYLSPQSRHVRWQR